ncbi:MAG: hypothetical protein VX699_13740 [Myxococcota bacterium]|nr:hypothetical protein [Myxococcota bacterium]
MPLLPPRPFHRSAALIAATALLLTGAPLWAHGNRPMVRKIVNDAPDQPQGLQFTRGFAQRLEDGRWQFVCPWFAHKTPYPLSAPAGPTSMWIAGNTDLFLVKNGVPTPTEQPEFSGGLLRGLTSLHDNIYLLQSDPPDASRLLRLDEDATPVTLRHFESPWEAMSHSQGLLFLGRAQADTLSILVYDPANDAILSDTTWPTPGLVKVLGTTRINDTLFAALQFMDRTSLYRLDTDAHEIVSGVYQTNLPQNINGTLVTIVDSQLLEIHGDTAAPIATAGFHIYEMFHPTAHGILLSTSRGLYRFDTFDAPLEPVFVFGQLHPPLIDELNGRDLDFCETFWSDLHRDWGLPETPLTTPEETAPTEFGPSTKRKKAPSGGCHQVAPGPTMLLFSVLLLFKRRLHSWRTSHHRVPLRK